MNIKNFGKYTKCHLNFPYISFRKFYCFCEKPIKINMKNSTLHCDNAPAIQYADDFNIYCLNGVRVTKEIVETSAYDLNPKLVLTEKMQKLEEKL